MQFRAFSQRSRGADQPIGLVAEVANCKVDDSGPGLAGGCPRPWVDEHKFLERELMGRNRRRNQQQDGKGEVAGGTDEMGNHLMAEVVAGREPGKAGALVAFSRARRIAFSMLLLGLGACAAPKPGPEAPPQPVWTSAIGHLTIGGQRLGCTAVLVRPDVIATVSHCLYPNGVQVPADMLLFTPSGNEVNAGYRGQAILETGGAVTPGRISENEAAKDWALVQIEPDDSVWPVPLAPISPDQVRADLADGATFYSAGYGSGAKTKLVQHQNCGPLPADPGGITEGEVFFATSCIVRLGDSGGPVALIEGGSPKLVGLIVGFAAHPQSGEPIAVIVSTKAFASHLGAPLVSFNGKGPSAPSVVPANGRIALASLCKSPMSKVALGNWPCPVSKPSVGWFAHASRMLPGLLLR